MARPPNLPPGAWVFGWKPQPRPEDGQLARVYPDDYTRAELAVLTAKIARYRRTHAGLPAPHLADAPEEPA